MGREIRADSSLDSSPANFLPLFPDGWKRGGKITLPLASRAKFVQADNARVSITRPVPKLSLRDRVPRFEEEV